MKNTAYLNTIPDLYTLMKPCGYYQNMKDIVPQKIPDKFHIFGLYEAHEASTEQCELELTEQP